MILLDCIFCKILFIYYIFFKLKTNIINGSFYLYLLFIVLANGEYVTVIFISL